MVVEVDGEQAEVVSRPLVMDGAHVREGDPVSERAHWSVEGTGGAAWGWVCDVITREQADSLREHEQRQRVAIGLCVT